MSAAGDAAGTALDTASAASPFGAWQAVAWSLGRDLRIAVRTRAELGVQLLFYVIVIMLFPLSVGAEPALLRAIGPGVAWVAALLAVRLGLTARRRNICRAGELQALTLTLSQRERELNNG